MKSSKALFQVLGIRSKHKHKEFVEETLTDIENDVKAISQQLNFMKDELSLALNLMPGLQHKLTDHVQE